MKFMFKKILIITSLVLMPNAIRAQAYCYQVGGSGVYQCQNGYANPMGVGLKAAGDYMRNLAIQNTQAVQVRYIQLPTNKVMYGFTCLGDDSNCAAAKAQMDDILKEK